jgi:hypothetical protein
VENVLVILIVGVAVAWVGREYWRALRPGRASSSCGCPSAGRCSLARHCVQAASSASVVQDNGTQGGPAKADRK